MALEFLMQGEVDRTLPHAETDGTDIDPRLSRYREQMTVPAILTKHVLSDEGTYFVTNNAQSGIATAAAPTAFSATNPFLLFYNTSAPSDDFALRCYFDYFLLGVTAAGTAGANVQCAVTVDRGNRYASGGTELTNNSRGVNQSTSRPSSMRVYAGNITATAPTSNPRTLVGQRFLKGAIPVIGDQYEMRFGTTDVGNAISISTVTFSTNHVPPIILGPDESALFHLWLPSQSAASSYLPELGWWER